MSEDEWQKFRNPSEALQLLGGKVSVRRLRLIACACCRMVWNRLDAVCLCRYVEAAEQVADQVLTPSALGSIVNDLYQNCRSSPDIRQCEMYSSIKKLVSPSLEVREVIAS